MKLIHLLLLPFLLVLVLVFVCAAIFVLHLFLISVFFIRRVLVIARIWRNTKQFISGGFSYYNTVVIKWYIFAQMPLETCICKEYKKINTHHTCCHALIYPVPYPSCGPYVCVPSLCTCLYACGSLQEENSVTFFKSEWGIDWNNPTMDWRKCMTAVYLH